MMLLRMFPDHPEFARERNWLTRMVAVSLAVAILAIAIQIAPRLVS